VRPSPTNIHLRPIHHGVYDSAIATTGWFLPLMWLPSNATSITTTALVAGSLGLTQAGLGTALGTTQGHVATLHAITRRRIMRAGAVTVLIAVALVAALSSGTPQGSVTPGLVVAGGCTATAALLVWDGIAHRLRTRRRRDGRTQERVLIVADHRDAHDLLDLIEVHSDTGWRAVGWVDGDDAEPLVTTARRSGATSVLVAASALRRDSVQAQLHLLRERGLRVHMDVGLRDVHPRQLTLGALGFEPLLLMEPPRLGALQRVIKRSVDVIVASVMLLAALPILAMAALAIWVEDKGPVLFHQRRIGRHGVPFDLIKLRTMVPDAEARLAEVAHLNERHDGPLFKASHDPRVTRVGRVLRATSVDELPQLWRVVRGDMSLVGPRPALPDEVSQFDDRLMARHRMRPGLTGIWQVSHRDDPSFESYRRADLLYVENWSMLLDLGILARTVPTVLGRSWRSLRQRAVPSPEPVLP